MNFEGYEELKDMKKSDMINLFKDKVNPDRTRGGQRVWTETRTVVRKDIRGGLYEYTLTSFYTKERTGQDMARYRPIIGDEEYTWGELKRYPADLLRVMLYKYLLDTEEEE
tara:strand:- start:2030 stop:2362 length:333 start_codon:yes stop_codon:yes gene_type:complete